MTFIPSEHMTLMLISSDPVAFTKQLYAVEMNALA